MEQADLTRYPNFSTSFASARLIENVARSRIRRLKCGKNQQALQVFFGLRDIPHEPVADWQRNLAASRQRRLSRESGGQSSSQIGLRLKNCLSWAGRLLVVSRPLLRQCLRFFECRVIAAEHLCVGSADGAIYNPTVLLKFILLTCGAS
jgi:hypothetical protein